mgnify:FL=1
MCAQVIKLRLTTCCEARMRPRGAPLNAHAQYYFRKEEIIMPQNKLQEFVFTTIMAMLMVYGMICYNVALSTGGFTNQTFVMALHEMPIMWPIAIVLELFVVGKLAPMLAFKIVRPTDRPQVITFMISFYICIMMCPIMSLIATVLFKDSPSVGTFIQTWGMNLPVALLWQLCYCGPLVRLIFRTIFKRQLAGSGCVEPSKEPQPEL